MPVPAVSATEIACDESGFTGGNLTIPHTVFAHASIRIAQDAAAEEMARLRRRVVAHGELKASWLLRWCDHDDLVRLLGPNRVLDGVLVHLSDTRLFLLSRLTDALLGIDELSGLDLPGRDPGAREAAGILHQHGEIAFGGHRWQRFLVAAGNVLRTNSRWIPPTATEDFETMLDDLAAAAAPAPIRRVLRRLRSATDRVRVIRPFLEEDARRPPLLEPLLPALTYAVMWWGADHRDLAVVHDEQSALTPWRVAEIAGRLGDRHRGHTLHLTRVDSRDDPRVQIADLVAGIARRAAAGLLSGRPDPELLALVEPLVDPESIWADATWQNARSFAQRS